MEDVGDRTDKLELFAEELFGFLGDRHVGLFAGLFGVGVVGARFLLFLIVLRELAYVPHVLQKVLLLLQILHYLYLSLARLPQENQCPTHQTHRYPILKLILNKPGQLNMLLLKRQHFLGYLQRPVIDLVRKRVKILFAVKEPPGLDLFLVLGLRVDVHDLALVFVDAPVLQSVLV